MPKTILIVDDDAVSRELLQHTLSQKGYQISTAEDGGPALEMVLKNPPDLILLDIEMPNVNGYTFITELRHREAQKGSAKIAVLVLTAHDKMEPIFKRHGVRGYLLKPIDMLSLLKRVKEILGE